MSDEYIVSMLLSAIIFCVTTIAALMLSLFGNVDIAMLLSCISPLPMFFVTVIWILDSNKFSGGN